ncbi:Ig-like domain-containing protein [Mycolicibacterium sp. D5.8-2]|uniref:Ig-like domain-containing protein n=1 Tax=Mycolicibacterium sp. D5.8-2 TaxID=3085903 RepID=UPI00298C5E69|nr:Ig-like domain-containing protein [Mycolicibacterium sp. D5.8-2]MDW5611554.1 Ig-like domain-containing protein [Mycolicibacterium sp. D5.8-2]
MSAQQRVGWVAGVAVSAGIGAAVLLGGTGTATADAPSSASDTGDPSSEAAERGDTDQDAVTASAESVDADQDPRDDEDPRDDVAGQTVSSASSGEETDEIDDAVEVADADEEAAAAEETESEGTDSGDPAPAQTQAVASLMSSARRGSSEPGEAAAEVPNSAPSVTTSVGVPDPLSGVTNIAVTGLDPDGDQLRYTAARPTFGRVTGDGTGAFTYTPTFFSRLLARFVPFVRSDRFAVTVSDGRGGVTSSTVNLTIVPLNSAPRARATTVNTPVQATGVVTGKANATDPNWDRLTFVASTVDTAKGRVTVNGNGTFIYTPTAAARHGAAAAAASTADRTDTFRVAVADAYGAVTEIPVTVTISPANVAPTATAGVQNPDAATGLVAGTVIGTDADGDGLTYSGPTATAKGTVVVAADGAITYRPNEIARRIAASVYSTPASRSDTFGVTVTDGHGGSATVTVTVAIAPDTQSAAAVPPSTFCGCTLMPADTIFHADIRGLPTLSESNSWIDLLGGGRGATLAARWGGSEWMGSTAGIPVNVVGADHPTEDVVFNRGYSTTGPGIDDRPYAIPDRPLVEGMPSYPAWDRHLFVFQEGTCISQELINVANGVELPGAGILDILGNAVYRSIWGSSWIAQGGVHYDMNSGLYPAIGYANASQLPQVPMMLRPDEIERGYVDHMLGMTIAKDLGAGYVWPARAGDGSGADGVPMGMVFRLREDVDLSGYAESTQAVLRALQVHGAVIYDSSGPGGEGLNLAGMSNGWEGTDFQVMQRELSTIPVQWFEAVDVVGLAADPAVGWQVK